MPCSARAYVPGHVTGIFRIHDSHEDPLHCGSTGAGFCLAAGTTTTVKLEENPFLEISVEYNDSKIDAPVTVTVIRRLLEEHESDYRIHVRHESSLPIGVGFGASGAGALGTALALSHLLGQSDDTQSTASHAHYAEVVNRTGLGDVIAQTAGGMEIRIRPGAPGIGEVVNIPFPEDLQVVLAGAPGLETRSVLSDKNHREGIIKAADGLMSDLIDDPSVEQFISSSREFARATNLMTPRVRSSLDDLESQGFNDSSMVMIGDSVFCFSEPGTSQRAADILAKRWDRSEILLSSISGNGGRLV